MRAAACLLFTVACAAPAAPPPTVALALPLPSPPAQKTNIVASPRVAESEDRDFTSDRGFVHLAVSAENVLVGTYPNGVMTCTESRARDEELVSCHWYEGMSDGRAIFRREADGTLTGTWGTGVSMTDGGTWALVPVPRGGIAGVWDTNWGIAIVKDTGSGMHAEYPGGTLDCEARSARRYACTWVEGSLTGAAELAIESPRVLRGRWGTGSSATDGGAWLFVKR